jgi:HK97 family phage major capsid protein
VSAIVQQSVDAALKAYRDQLEAEPPLKQAAFKVAAEVREEEPLYKSFGTFLLDVAKSAQGPVNRRMEELKSADPLDENGYNVAKAMGQPFVGSMAQAAIKAPTGLNEGLGASGGFLVSQDRAASLIERMYDTGQVLSRVDMTGISANSNGMTFYAEDETSRINGARRGGIQAYWRSEGVAVTASKPAFREMELKLRAVMGLVYATDEMLSEAVTASDIEDLKVLEAIAGLSAATADSATALGNVARAAIASVATTLSLSATLKVLGATVCESAAVASSATEARKTCAAAAASETVLDSATAAPAVRIEETASEPVLDSATAARNTGTEETASEPVLDSATWTTKVLAETAKESAPVADSVTATFDA